MLRQNSSNCFTTDDRDIFLSSSRVSCDWGKSDLLRTSSNSSQLPAFAPGLLQSRRLSKSIGDLITKWETLDALDNENTQNIKPIQTNAKAGGKTDSTLSCLNKKTSLKTKYSNNFDPISEGHERMPKSEIKFKTNWIDGKDQKTKIINVDNEINRIIIDGGSSDEDLLHAGKGGVDVNNNRVSSRRPENQARSVQETMKPAPSKEGGLLRSQNVARMTTLKAPRTDRLKSGALSRNESYKMSKKLSRKMTLRQKQKLIMDSEFDEFEDGNEDDKEPFVAGSSSGGSSSAKPFGGVGNSSISTKDGVDGGVGAATSTPKESLARRKEEKGGCMEERKGSVEEDEDLIMKLNMKNMQEGSNVCAQESSDVDAFEEEEEEEEEDEDEERVVLTKVQKIAEELLVTEKNYIDRLHLLDQLFQMNVTLANRQHNFFPEHTIPEIFSNIKSIYQFHTFLYPQLEKAVVGQQHPELGQVLSKYGPFLKLYIEYVRNFSHGINLLNHWLEKSPVFSKLITDLQTRPECGHLGLQHHMLEPVQRVPRYELLLKDYLKNLPEDSSDRPFAEKSLKIVKDAAQHSNDAMRKIEKFKGLLDVNEKLGDSIDLVSPTRELVKEGRITRLTRDGSLIERYIFLFNDLLLVCQVGTLKQQYRLKSKMNLDDMEINESHNLEIPNTFYVRCQEKSIELHCSTQEEKIEWQMAFWRVINEFQEKLKTRKRRMTIMYPVKTDVLGKRAPLWVKDNETSMCMRCGVAFTAFRRRHHCRACGLVVCKVCSSFRTRLAFSGRNEDRVCTFCFNVLTGNQASYLAGLGEVSVTHASNSVMEGFKAGKMRLQVKASAPSVMSGYMHVSRDRHNWYKRYFAALSTFLLYSFKAPQDVVAMTSLPLPGYHVKMAEPCENPAKENMFKIYHDGEKKVYYFQVENVDNLYKWIEALQMLSRLEIPNLEASNNSSFSPTPKSP